MNLSSVEYKKLSLKYLTHKSKILIIIHNRLFSIKFKMHA